MIEYTGAGLMTLICLIIIIGVGTLLYQSSASHPDAGLDPETWLMRQVHLDTGRMRYVNTKTTDKDIALGMVEAVNLSEVSNWHCTGIISAGDLLD